MSEQTSKRPIIFLPHGLGGIIMMNVSGIFEDILISSTDGHKRSSTQTPSNSTG